MKILMGIASAVVYLVKNFRQIVDLIDHIIETIGKGLSLLAQLAQVLTPKWREDDLLVAKARIPFDWLKEKFRDLKEALAKKGG